MNVPSASSAGNREAPVRVPAASAVVRGHGGPTVPWASAVAPASPFTHWALGEGAVGVGEEVVVDGEVVVELRALLVVMLLPRGVVVVGAGFPDGRAGGAAESGGAVVGGGAGLGGAVLGGGASGDEVVVVGRIAAPASALP